MKAKTLTFAAALIAAICLLLAGCAEGTDKQQPEQQTIQTYTSVASVIKANPPVGKEIRIKAGILTKDGIPFVTDVSIDTYPAQPDRPNIAIYGLPFDKFNFTETKGEYSGAVDIIVKLTSAIDPDGTTKAEFVRLP
ncbi:hypothetical protein F7D09_0129 [Bifidobacterium leontopitheci]|uniref:Lipoprotein n=2 Tax=Bifidobacterium leontopitheci TaxID=2650774 RepID=A0A6I1GII9_9BIFI|nr:hypothetical protein F7D09_0129 [Bifidobacterium leontopitheci]